MLVSPHPELNTVDISLSIHPGFFSVYFCIWYKYTDTRRDVRKGVMALFPLLYLAVHFFLLSFTLL